MTDSPRRVLIHHPTRAEEYADALRERFPELEIDMTAEAAHLARQLPAVDVLVISASIPFPDGP